MPKRGKVFKTIGALHPKRSAFDLSFEKKFSTDFGLLIPVCVKTMIPGDTFHITSTHLLRFEPLVRPIMHEVNAFTHWFFVPHRIMSDKRNKDIGDTKTFVWEDYISGGEDGENTMSEPRWNSSFDTGGWPKITAIGNLWDHLGYQTDLPANYASTTPTVWGLWAYNMVYNEYYRDQNLIEEIDLNDINIKKRAWTKDYFSSALPFQQRGTAPSVPINSIADIDIEANSVYENEVQIDDGSQTPAQVTWPGGTIENSNNAAPGTYYLETSLGQEFFNWIRNQQINISIASTFDVADLRNIFQLQKFLERNARAGVRYTEFLKSHYGVDPGDARLQRPEYIGGSKTAIIVSEVLQTGQTTTEGNDASPQGNLAGHGITANRTKIGKYHAREWGILIGIMSVMPKPAYQQGIDREWLTETRYDYPIPEFAHLSEQAIQNMELCVTGEPNQDTGVFGYQGIYDHFRIARDIVCGNLRKELYTWDISRIFDPNNPPALNQAFIECDSQTLFGDLGYNILKRCFAVPSEDGIIVNHGTGIRAIRPLPHIAEPGLLDHF